MTRHWSRFGVFAAAAALALTLGAPAAASAQRVRGNSGGGDDGGARSGGGDSGGSRPVAIPRGGDSGPRGGSSGGSSGGGRVVTGGSSGGDASAPRARGDAGQSDGARAVPRRDREDRPVVGTAVPRSDVPRGTGNTVIVAGGRYYGSYYPWGYGGLGLGSYYGWYDPWYDPFYYGYGGYGGYGGYYGYSGSYAGRLRIKVQPSDAEVYVDGYYAGIVDEFDNPFQSLSVESGPHRIEVREEGYEPLTFEVRILPGRTITYRGELKKAP